MNPEAPRPTPPALVALAWIVVSLPLAWGVTRSIEKALPLFRAAPPPAPARP